MTADERGGGTARGRQSHRFGGTWTERKLEVLAGYLQSYTTALKNKPTPASPFRKGFIDAFAGTGYRNARREDDGSPQARLAFPDLLFGTQEDRVAKASMETIGRYFNDRLKTVFPGVAEKPGVLRNSVNNPLYLLCFAAANDRGAPTALKIANHLLRELR